MEEAEGFIELGQGCHGQFFEHGQLGMITIGHQVVADDVIDVFFQERQVVGGDVTGIKRQAVAVYHGSLVGDVFQDAGEASGPDVGSG